MTDIEDLMRRAAPSAVSPIEPTALRRRASHRQARRRSLAAGGAVIAIAVVISTAVLWPEPTSNVSTDREPDTTVSTVAGPTGSTTPLMNGSEPLTLGAVAADGVKRPIPLTQVAGLPEEYLAFYSLEPGGKFCLELRNTTSPGFGSICGQVNELGSYTSFYSTVDPERGDQIVLGMVAPSIDALEFTFEEYVINFNDPDPQPEPAPPLEPISVPTFEVDGLEGARVFVAALPRVAKTATGYASGEKVMFTDRP